MHRRFAFAVAGLLSVTGLVTTASAADLAARTKYTKAPPMMAAIYDWSGFYLGLNGGWGSNRDCRSDVTTGAAFGCHNGTGGVVGGQAGYRWQTGAWVFGLEGQGNWADLSGSGVSLANAANTVRSKMDAFGLFTGQIGYSFNNALIYAKGGAAVTDTRYDVLSAGTVTASSGTNANWGGTIGAGFEYGFTRNWSAAIEYDHIFQSARNMTFTTPAGVAVADTIRSGGDTDLVTARINYRFGGPVVAKY